MRYGQRQAIGLDEARERVLAELRAPRPEEVDLAVAAERVLLQSSVCREPFPAVADSAMDGFAVRCADLVSRSRLRAVGDSYAGRPYPGVVGEGECARVMTGGLIPEGADAVVPVEDTSGFASLSGGEVEFRIRPAPGANIRPRGSVRGEGETVLHAGTRLRPAHIGVLAHLGMRRVTVGRRPRVAVVPTGDEVVDLDATPRPGQVRNSNAWALAAQITRAGGVPTLLPVLRDREGETRTVLAAALAAHDLVCTIGGVSMGTRDLVRPAFDDLGGAVKVQAIHIKPGKPTLFGTIETGEGGSCLLGLPGNPASAFTIFALLGAPWVLAFQGGVAAPRRWGRLRGAGPRAGPRPQALPARISLDSGTSEVAPLAARSSADLFSLADADALLLVPAEQSLLDGDLVEWIELP